MTDWVAVLFIGFKVCVLGEHGSTSPDPRGREFWVRPDRVVGFGPVEQLSGVPCTKLQVGDRTVYVIGSPQEVYRKITDAGRD